MPRCSPASPCSSLFELVSHSTGKVVVHGLYNCLRRAEKRTANHEITMSLLMMAAANQVFTRRAHQVLQLFQKMTQQNLHTFFINEHVSQDLQHIS
jgi:hypothetical protein